MLLLYVDIAESKSWPQQLRARNDTARRATVHGHGARATAEQENAIIYERTIEVRFERTARNANERRTATDRGLDRAGWTWDRTTHTQDGDAIESDAPPRRPALASAVYICRKV